MQEFIFIFTSGIFCMEAVIFTKNTGMLRFFYNFYRQFGCFFRKKHQIPGEEVPFLSFWEQKNRGNRFSVRGDTCVLTYRNRSFSVVTEDFFSATVGQTYPALNIRSISVTIICVASSR